MILHNKINKKDIKYSTNQHSFPYDNEIKINLSCYP